MDKLNSISLFIMGAGMLLLARFVENQYVKILALLLSMVLSLMAIVRNLREKRRNKL